jgi:hypothetical protein
MIDYHPVDFSERFQKEYWYGKENMFIRLFTYLRSGFGLVNEARNYIFSALAVYWTVKTGDFWGIHENWILLAMFIGIPILVAVGRWDLYRASKARQFITTQHGSIVRFQTHNLQVLQTAILEEMAKKLGVDMEEVEKKLESKKNGH